MKQDVNQDTMRERVGWESLLPKALCGLDGGDTTHNMGPYCVLPTDISYLAISFTFSFSLTHRRPYCLLHLQPWFCHLLFSGVLLPALCSDRPCLCQDLCGAETEETETDPHSTEQSVHQCQAWLPTTSKHMEGQRINNPQPGGFQPCVQPDMLLPILPHRRHTSDTHLLVYWYWLCLE